MLKENESGLTMVLTSKESIQNLLKEKKKKEKNSIQTEGTDYRSSLSVGGDRFQKLLGFAKIAGDISLVPVFSPQYSQGDY